MSAILEFLNSVRAQAVRLCKADIPPSSWQSSLDELKESRAAINDLQAQAITDTKDFPTHLGAYWVNMIAEIFAAHVKVERAAAAMANAGSMTNRPYKSKAKADAMAADYSAKLDEFVDLYNPHLSQISQAIRVAEKQFAQQVPPKLAEQTDPVARAIALMIHADKEGTIMEVSDLVLIVGCGRSTLYRDPRFTATRKALKQKRRSEIPSGTRSKKGVVEATGYDPDEE